MLVMRGAVLWLRVGVVGRTRGTTLRDHRMCDLRVRAAIRRSTATVSVTVATMGTEPSNAATEVAREFIQAWNDRERFLSEWDKWFAEGFVREDRRRLIAMPDADSSTYKEEFRSWHELTGEGHPIFDYAEVIAIHGERLGCNRTFARFGSNTSMEVLRAHRGFDVAIV